MSAVVVSTATFARVPVPASELYPDVWIDNGYPAWPNRSFEYACP